MIKNSIADFRALYFQWLDTHPLTTDLGPQTLGVAIPDHVEFADWRNFIPNGIRLLWPALDNNQRLLVAFMAQTMSHFTQDLLQQAEPEPESESEPEPDHEYNQQELRRYQGHD